MKERGRNVAQIFNLPYRRIAFGGALPASARHEFFAASADCKSAIQQIENLRYGSEPRGSGSPPENFVRFVSLCGSRNFHCQVP
jgi:hypothetical protein